MCAIAGIAGQTPANKNFMVEHMLATMKHRGPDHTEVMKVDEEIFFGHNRLGIIDLQAAANQPFVSEDGRYTIVFNGEIYNYLELRTILKYDFSFRTNSDTEVLLAAFQKWGTACLDKLIGMFSFALWDKQKKVLVAARDRFGVKPFYYSEVQDAFFFASEIKALWAAGVLRVPNKKVWASFFVHGSYGMPQETFWQDIHQLPAGHFMVRTPDGAEITRWYNFETAVKENQPELAGASEQEITTRYFKLLNESVKLRFRADVPVGFNVSGGLDSSLLLSLIKQYNPGNTNIHAYTFFTGNTDYDELPWVNALMATTAYPLHAVKLEAHEVPKLAGNMARLQDEPFGGLPTLAYANLFKEARKQNTIVLLDGQGIDEAWAGYDYYQTANSSIVQGVTGSPVRPEALLEEFRNLAIKPQYPEPFGEKLLNLQYRDLFFTKIPRALRFNDRASMQYSTELREPFLDHRLVEMAFALPRHSKIHEGNGKYLLRKVTSSLLPDSIRFAPKRALQTPQREWLAHELLDWADARVKAFSCLPGIDTTVVQKLWRQYQSGKGDNSFYIWQWINATFLL